MSSQAMEWLSELYQVMLRTHSHVGCSVFEIQLQKDELQAFQETAKVCQNNLRKVFKMT